MNKFLSIHRFFLRSCRARAQKFTKQPLLLSTIRSFSSLQDDIMISLSNNPRLV